MQAYFILSGSPRKSASFGKAWDVLLTEHKSGFSFKILAWQILNDHFAFLFIFGSKQTHFYHRVKLPLTVLLSSPYFLTPNCLPLLPPFALPHNPHSLTPITLIQFPHSNSFFPLQSKYVCCPMQ